MKQELIEVIKKTIIEAGRIALASYYQNLDVKIKKDQSVFTEIDLKIEKYIYQELNDLVFNSIFIGEEDSEELRVDAKKKLANKAFAGEYIWAIDPIDGTTNYLCHFADFTISIGLLKKGIKGFKPFLGFIYKPCHDKLYYTDGEHAYLVINASKKGKKTKINPFLFSKNDFLHQIFVIDSTRIGKYDLKNFRHVRALGGMAEQIASVAAGEAMATVIHAHLWDVAAGLAIAQVNDIFIYDFDSGQRVEEFILSDFVFSEKLSWVIKKDYLLVNEKMRELFIKEVKK